MKIVISGLPYFANKLAKQLADFDITNRYVATPVENGGSRLRAFMHMLGADVLYMIGGTVRRSRQLDLAMLLRKKIVMHWVGTDVLNAKKAIEQGVAIPSYLMNATHWCEVDWIQKELSAIGIRAGIVSIASFESQKSGNPFHLPQEFSILSYMSKGRERFYGMDMLVKLAEAMPDISIKIAGISEYSEPLPSNIKLLGWVNDMDKEYRDCVLYLRLAEHDGLAFSVLEALSLGRYVGYSYRFPYTKKISSSKRLVEYVRRLKLLFDGGRLKSNDEGARKMEREYRRELVVGRITEQLAIS